MKKQKIIIKKSDLPVVSFIIPTLNASKFLPNCLRAIRSQDYPQSKIEIVIADGGSTDSTREIGKEYKAKIIDNPEVLHEPGKARASKVATGEIFFFTDSDNELSNKHWVTDMVRPYRENPDMNIKGFLAQTIPPKRWNSFDRYMGYLATDPFTWFIYRWASIPRTYGNLYTPIKKTSKYQIYKFDVMNHPLLGLSQGFGTIASFKREKLGHSDDILSGIKLIAEGGLIAYVPSAGIYHYHVTGFKEFTHKYTWRIRNNLHQKVKGMGLVNRQKYLNGKRRLRQVLFPLYSISLIFPLIDTLHLYKYYKDKVVFWHMPACLILSLIMAKELFLFSIGIKLAPGSYARK
jgi:glycosyltransferase involved in cell wall biosynthesis